MDNVKEEIVPKQEIVSKKDFKKIYFGVGLGIIVLLLGCTIVLATKAWDPSWNPFQPNPMKILNSSVSRFSDMQYLHTDVDMNIDAIDKGEKIGLEYKMSMDVDNNSEQSKSLVDMSIGILSNGIKMVFSADAIGIGDIAYMRLKGVPYLIQMQLETFGVDIKKYANKWYRVAPSEWGITLDTSINGELMEKLENLSNKYSIIKFVKRLDSEVINDEATFHYLFRVNSDEAMKYILDLFTLVRSQVGEEVAIAGEPAVDEIYAEMETLFNVVEPIEFEVWIGKSTHVLYKFRYQKMFDAGVLRSKGIDIPDGEDGDTINVGLEVRLSDLNVVNYIEAPEESESLLDLFTPFIDQLNELQANPDILGGTCVDNPEI